MDRLGPYRLRKRLAVGGMGEVYLGEKLGPEGFVKPVVLKCVLPQLAKDHAFVQLFLDEARLAALLNHPNIAQIYECQFADDVCFIAMEYVAGYTVDDVRRKLKSIGQLMPVEHVAQIASQVCQGLGYAHELTDGRGVGLGIVHRDVSPHNLIISLGGSVKIVDFGIAKARAGLLRVQARGAVGKYGYMSPEQARGEGVDARSDIFSLGVCLWELVTSQRLHDPALDRAPDYAPSRPIRSPESLRSGIPRQLLHILETALAIAPEDRFPSCQAMHLELERFLAAMTHYAGHAALSDYIKALADGQLEKPQAGPRGGLVEPARKAATGSSEEARTPFGGGASMEAAQRYEEVFGVSMEGSRPTLSVVPESWALKPRPIAVDPGRGGPSPSLDAAARTAQESAARPDRPAEGPAAAVKPMPTLDLDWDPARARPSRRWSAGSGSRPLPRVQRSRVGRSFALLALGLAILAGFLVAKGPALWRTLASGPEPREMLTSVYRIESEPEGAQVLLDGRIQSGVTPVEVELIPEVEYVVTVRRRGYGTTESTVRASVGTEVRPLRFVLRGAATVQVITRPPGATVRINGREIPNRVTPLTVDDAPGDQPIRIVASLKGRPDAAETIEVPAGQRRTVRLSMADR